MTDHGRFHAWPVFWGAALRFLIGVAVFGSAAAWWRFGLHRTDRVSFWWIAAAMIVLAVLLVSLSRAISRLVDRLALGHSDNGARAVRELLNRMATSLPIDEVLPRLAEATSRTVGQSRTEVQVLLAEGMSRSQVWPPDASGLRRAGRSAVAVRVAHDNVPVGSLSVDVESEGLDAVGDERADLTRRLLEQLAGPAGVALATVRLTDDLRARRQRLDATRRQLSAANERLLAAGETERRRLGQQVDRRVRPVLDAVIEGLKTGQSSPDADGRIEKTLDDLRDIARGIYPPRLDEAGLAVALSGWLTRHGISAQLDIDESTAELLSVRPAVRTCLYFCAVTTLELFGFSAVGDQPVRIRVAVDSATPAAPWETASDEADERRVLLHIDSGPHDDLPDFQIVRDRAEAFDGQFTVDDGSMVTIAIPLEVAPS